MDLLELSRMLRRQRLIVVPMVVLVVLGLAFTYASSPPQYRSTGSVVLLNPEPSDAPASTSEGLNPYTRFNDLSVVVDIVARRMRTPEVAAAMATEGVTGVVTVAANLDFYRGPIIDVVAEAGSAERATTSARLAMDQIGRQVEALQIEQGTEESNLIRTADVVQPQQASQVFSSTLRRLLAAGVLGVGAVLGAAIVAETLGRAQRQREEAREPVDGDGNDGEFDRRLRETVALASVTDVDAGPASAKRGAVTTSGARSARPKGPPPIRPSRTAPHAVAGAETESVRTS